MKRLAEQLIEKYLGETEADKEREKYKELVAKYGGVVKSKKGGGTWLRFPKDENAGDFWTAALKACPYTADGMKDQQMDSLSVWIPVEL